MMPVQAARIARIALLLSVVWVAMVFAAPAESDDPYVLLDAAKMQLGEGKLRGASKLMAEIPIDNCEDYVREDVLLQQLLVIAAFFSATHFVLGEVEHYGFEEDAYRDWLAAERDSYAAELSRLAKEYLAVTAHGPALDFARFRLPVVTSEHLADVELYTDPEILHPAAVNWADEREGLGRGIIAGQTRVALVLSVARFYDRDTAASSLAEVTARLTGGVPLEYAVILDWLAETASLTDECERLTIVAVHADARLLALPMAITDAKLVARAEARIAVNNGEAGTSS